MTGESEKKTGWFVKMKMKISAKLIEPDSTVKTIALSTTGTKLEKVPIIMLSSMNNPPMRETLSMTLTRKILPSNPKLTTLEVTFSLQTRGGMRLNDPRGTYT